MSSLLTQNMLFFVVSMQTNILKNWNWKNLRTIHAHIVTGKKYHSLKLHPVAHEQRIKTHSSIHAPKFFVGETTKRTNDRIEWRIHNIIIGLVPFSFEIIWQYWPLFSVLVLRFQFLYVFDKIFGEFLIRPKFKKTLLI